MPALNGTVPLNRRTVYDQHIYFAELHLDQSEVVALDNERLSIDERSSDRDMVHQVRADVHSRLALAEQQRIANLITIAIDSQSPVGRPTFNREAREIAREQALAGLGLPTGGWE